MTVECTVTKHRQEFECYSHIEDSINIKSFVHC